MYEFVSDMGVGCSINGKWQYLPRWFTCQDAISGKAVKLFSVGTIHSFKLEHHHLLDEICCFSYFLSHSRWNCISKKLTKNKGFHLCGFFYYYYYLSVQNEFNQTADDCSDNCQQTIIWAQLWGWVSATSTKSIAMTVLLSVWWVMYCICLLTSLCIYQCLACNHCRHGPSW